MMKLCTGIVKGRNNSDTRRGQDRQYPSSLRLSNVTAATEEGDKAEKKERRKKVSVYHHYYQHTKHTMRMHTYQHKVSVLTS